MRVMAVRNSTGYAVLSCDWHIDRRGVCHMTMDDFIFFVLFEEFLERRNILKKAPIVCRMIT